MNLDRILDLAPSLTPWTRTDTALSLLGFAVIVFGGFQACSVAGAGNPIFGVGGAPLTFKCRTEERLWAGAATRVGVGEADRVVRVWRERGGRCKR